MDPLQQTPVAPAPVSPPEAPGIGSMPEGNLTPDQMRTNLQDLMGKIQAKYQDFNSEKFASENKLSESKGETLRAFFDMLQSLGIDPSNMEAVKGLLDKIRVSNPELHKQVEQALMEILGDEELDEGEIPQEEEIPEGEMPPQNMNINNEEVPPNI